MVSRALHLHAAKKSAPLFGGRAKIGLGGGCLAEDRIGSHHLVLLVLEDVAVVHVQELVAGLRVGRGRQIELGDDARNRSGIADHGVLPRWPLLASGRDRWTGVVETSRERVGIKRPPIDDLE